MKVHVRVRAAALAAAVVAASAAWAAAAPPAAADVMIGEVGWWTRNPMASAPAGGMDVSAAPDGPLSVGALSVTGSGSVTRAVLLFTEAGGVQEDGAKLQVCTTPNTWKSGAAQAWDEAPRAECSLTGVPLTRNGSTASWSADVTALLSGLDDDGGRVDLMVVPDGAGTVPLGFDVQLGPPSLQAEVDEEPSAGRGGDSSGFAGSDGEGGSGSFSGDGGGSSGAFSSSSAPSDSAEDASSANAFPTGTASTGLSADASPSGSSASIGSDVASTSPGDDSTLAAVPTQASTGADEGEGNRTLQALFFVLVAAVAGVLGGTGRWFLRQRSPDADAFA